MNNFHTDNLLEMAKEKNQEDVDSQAVWKATQGSSSNRWLASLGGWMIAKGEKLRTRYAATVQANPLSLSQTQIKKARAH